MTDALLVLLEAYNPRQPRWPKGHPNAGKWRPKGGVSFSGTRTSAASRARLERDLADVRASIANRSGSKTDPVTLMATGGRLYQLATKYSTAGAYRKRLADIEAEQRTIHDTAWDEIMAGTRTGDTDFTARERKRLDAISDEMMKLRGDIREADRDALVWALSGVRQMGGVKPRVGAVHSRDKSGYELDDSGEYYIRNGNQGFKYGKAGIDRMLAMDDAAESRADLQRITRYLPADWIRSLNAAGGLQITASDERAHATKVAGIAGLVTVKPEDRSTMLHEVLHVVEWRHGTARASGLTELQTATHGFHESRTKGEQFQPLSGLVENSGYRPDEMTKPDRWFDPYVGKLYKGEYADSTEVLTMGVQYLFFPHHRNDPHVHDRGTMEAIMGMLATL